MRVSALTSLVLVAVVATGCYKVSQPPAVAPAHFALVLEHSETGWSAHCEVGCRWSDVTMTCGGCAVRLDVGGIGPVASERYETGFAFVLAGSGPGWEAKGITGVRWLGLSWQCEQTTCRARIDETGVGSV